MDSKNKNFNRNIKNYKRFHQTYAKEAKVAIKSVKKLEETFDQSSDQMEGFLRQLAKLCACKGDNRLLYELGQDISNMRVDFKKITNPFKKKFQNLIDQLDKISHQFDGMEKIQDEYKDAHYNRIKYERRPKNINELIAKIFSIKPQQNDLINLSSEFDHAGKRMDRRLISLMKVEAMLEKSLKTQFLNQELAIVVHIRKFLKMFAEQQMEYEQDLTAFFDQIFFTIERDVPDTILNLDNNSLEKYFRPDRRPNFACRHTMTSLNTKTDQIPDPNHFRNLEKSKRTYSLDSCQEINKILDAKSPEQQLNRTGLYYGSLCSLNQKVTVDKNGNLVELNEPVNKEPIDKKRDLIDKQDHQICQLCNANKPTINSNELTIIKNNLFSATNFHRCELNHDQNRQQKNQVALNFDLKEAKSISPSASAPPINEWKLEDDEPNYLKKQKSIEQRALDRNNSINKENTNNYPKNCNDGHIDKFIDSNDGHESTEPKNQHSWLNQVYCSECQNYQRKVEEAALAFLNNYRNFKVKTKNCERTFHKSKEVKN